jgi:hypothetical protein
MRILIIDAYPLTSSGRSSFSLYLENVKVCFNDASMRNGGGCGGGRKPRQPDYIIERLCEGGIGKYVFEREGEDFTDTNAIQLFDTLDIILLQTPTTMLP